MSRFENQSIRLIEINRDLACPVLAKLVASRLRESSHVFEGPGGLQLAQSSANPLRSLVPVTLDQQTKIFALLLQLPRTKEHVH